jgi:hypothetical protein
MHDDFTIGVYDKVPLTHIAGPARFMGAEDVIGDLTECLDDIMVMEEGPHQYDPRPGWHDLGATRTGITIAGKTIKSNIAEMHPTQVQELFIDKPTVAFFWKKAEAIEAMVLDGCTLYPMLLDVPWRGESMSTPLALTFRNGTIIHANYGERFR